MSTGSSTEVSMKCALCHLFVVENPAYAGDPERNAHWIHLGRAGAWADEVITATHTAQPSEFTATLAAWRRYGPAAMRLRFDYPTEPDLVGRYLAAATRAAEAGHDQDGALAAISHTLRQWGDTAKDSVVGLDLVQQAGDSLNSARNPIRVETAAGRLRDSLKVVLGVQPQDRMLLAADLYATRYPNRATAANELWGFLRWVDPAIPHQKLHDATNLLDAAYRRHITEAPAGGTA